MKQSFHVWCKKFWKEEEKKPHDCRNYVSDFVMDALHPSSTIPWKGTFREILEYLEDLGARERAINGFIEAWKLSGRNTEPACEKCQEILAENCQCCESSSESL